MVGCKRAERITSLPEWILPPARMGIPSTKRTHGTGWDEPECVGIQWYPFRSLMCDNRLPMPEPLSRADDLSYYPYKANTPSQLYLQSKNHVILVQLT